MAMAFSYQIDNPLPQITADKVVIDKSDRVLILLRDGKQIKSYRISIGRGGIGRKTVEGDNLTPEGLYKIDRHNVRSSYYKSLHIDYPNEQDVKTAAKSGESAGSDIMIHGLRPIVAFLGKAHLLVNWTRGCIAVTNPEMDELWRAIPDGTVIEIRQ